MLGLCDGFVDAGTPYTISTIAVLGPMIRKLSTAFDAWPGRSYRSG